MVDIAAVLVSVPAITATTQWVKTTFNINGRWSQLAAVLVGIIFTAGAAGITYQGGYTVYTLARSVMEGFLYGLAAAGFYDLASGNLKGGTHEPSPQAGVTVDSRVSSMPDHSCSGVSADSQLASDSVSRGKHEV